MPTNKPDQSFEELTEDYATRACLSLNLPERGIAFIRIRGYIEDAVKESCPPAPVSQPMPARRMRIVDIVMAGNEHGQLRADTIYAKLLNEEGGVLISATLEYILAAIRRSNYDVEGVTVKWSEQRGARCSEVKFALDSAVLTAAAGRVIDSAGQCECGGECELDCAPDCSSHRPHEKDCAWYWAAKHAAIVQGEGK